MVIVVATGTVAIQYVRAVIDSARARGVDVRAVLSDSGISSQLLAQDNSRVSRQQANHLVQALWNVTGDELGGMGPTPVPRGAFRMMTLGVVHASDLDEALRRLIEFSGIAIGFDSAQMVQTSGQARLSLEMTGETDADQLIAGIIAAVVHRFACWLIGQQIELTSVILPGAAPSYSQVYLSAFGVEPDFAGSSAALIFPARYLRAPVSRTDAELFELLRTSPNDLVFRSDYRPSMSGRVRRIIERSLVRDVVSACDVATRLNISEQHMRRLLGLEGATFRHIKEEVLREEAVASLAKGQESIDELSARLGFSEPSAFRRAFRRWTGSPPGAYGRRPRAIRSRAVGLAAAGSPKAC